MTSSTEAAPPDMEYLQALISLAWRAGKSRTEQPVDNTRSSKSKLSQQSNNMHITPKIVSPPRPLSPADVDTDINTNEDELLSRFETIFDKKFREFEDHTLKPIVNGINRIEEMLATTLRTAEEPLHGTARPCPQYSMPGSYLSPSQASSHSSVASDSESASKQPNADSRQEPSIKTMKMVADLLAQIEIDGSSEMPAITLGSNLFFNDQSSTSVVDRKHLSDVENDNSSDWSDSKEVKPAHSKSRETQPHNKKNVVYSKYIVLKKTLEEKQRGETLVVVEPSGIVVRTLDPRPCHMYYLSNSGCIVEHCLFGHDYRLNAEHIGCLKKMVAAMPCTAMRNDVPCRDGKHCIYAHKCRYGFFCKFGESCRFFGIPGAHPGSEFHKKKNYYDDEGNEGVTKHEKADSAVGSS